MPDLPPRRRPPPEWTQRITERLTPTIKGFIIASACLYAFYVFVREARAPIEAHLALGPRLFAGEVWQPLTSLFTHLNPLGFIFNLMGVWFIGATMERLIGTRRFIVLFLASGVLANLAIAGVWRLRGAGPPVFDDGCWLPVLAMMVAFGRIHGRTQVQFWGALFLQARHLALIFVLWTAVASAARGDWGGVAGTAVTTLVGYFGATSGGFRDAWASFKAGRHRRRYQVLEGGASGRPKKRYMN
jgi:membrane associated rhomboid family serine protease